MPSTLSALSVIVPTFREAPNIRPLVERVFEATSGAGLEAEMIIVDDDSGDGTEAEVEALRGDYPVRLLVRRGERGLSGAVLAGFKEARHDRFVVLDADLQHPPEMIPALASRLDEPECDFVIGSRYARQGGVAEEWPWYRRIVSGVATALARPLAPLSDPMSGFFALERSTWRRCARLNPIGYKIGLELYVKARCRRPAEVPIAFGARAAGTSKLSLREELRYLRHLGRLYWFRFPVVTVLSGVSFVAAATAAVMVLSGAVN